MSVISNSHRVASSTDARVYLNLRERRFETVLDHRNGPAKPPLLLVHGATVASVLWDNPMPGWSWMDRLAADGFHVFALDLRGYGRSSRPDVFLQSPDGQVPYARAADVLSDVVDAIDYIRALTGAEQVDLLGGSWGTVICGRLVAQTLNLPVRRLILYAPLYSEPDARPAWLPPAAKPIDLHEEFRELGAYRLVSEGQLRQRWDEEIPLDDKSAWRPVGILEGLADASLADDKMTAGTNGTEFRVPNGTLVDLLAVYAGQPLYDATRISIPTLLLRGDADPTSTHADASRLYRLLSSDVKRYTMIGNGAHFMIGEKKIGEVHAVATGFLSENF